MDRIVGGKYKLGRKIGSGSFGEIHLGTHVDTFEIVAVKIAAETQICSIHYMNQLFEHDVIIDKLRHVQQKSEAVEELEGRAIRVNEPMMIVEVCYDSSKEKKFNSTLYLSSLIAAIPYRSRNLLIDLLMLVAALWRREILLFQGGPTVRRHGHQETPMPSPPSSSFRHHYSLACMSSVCNPLPRFPALNRLYNSMAFLPLRSVP
ncbi:hypothetical protein L1887_37988 [Cichorium endivia]|nr:hypothetical protein L1887_37988 [Cichorium endivia]